MFVVIVYSGVWGRLLDNKPAQGDPIDLKVENINMPAAALQG